MTTFTAICGKVCLSLGFCKQEHSPGRPLELSIASECVTLAGKILPRKQMSKLLAKN